MTPDQRLLLIGGYISSALYLSGCFVYSLVHGNGTAAVLALCAAGFSCVSYAVQIIGTSRREAIAATALSWSFGVGAGVAALLGV